MQSRHSSSENLCDIDPDSRPLSIKESNRFYSIVSKLLYVSLLRGRLDLLAALAFLSTRVSHPTHQDSTKLLCLMEYINGTLHFKLILGADQLDTLHTFIDVAYGVHADCKSQTGGCVSFGTCSIINKATKQKLVTKSSTEAKLVGASDYLGNSIWVNHFMYHQGYPIKQHYLEQDNESTIYLIKNGRALAGQRSKHINICHFWIKDRLGRDGFTLPHCDTASMLADFLSKPLQGSLFRKFCDALLGYAHLSSLSSTDSKPISPVERVGESILDGRGADANESHRSYASAAKEKMENMDMKGPAKTVSFNTVKT